MSEINLEMGKKRSRQQQSSNVAVAAVDSSESGDGVAEKTCPTKQICSHVAKSIDGNQIKKNVALYVKGKKSCAHCKEVNEEDNKCVEGNDDFWICLRCGARTCSQEHSSLHYDVPRSDSHALTLRIPSFSVWCHACKADIPSGYNKKLKTCISSVEQLYNKQINLQPLSHQDTKNLSKNKDEDGENKENKPKASVPLPLSPKRSSQIANSAPAVRGLTNLGNTCFFNSVLQCLAQTPGLVEAIREMETPDQQVNITFKSGASLNGKLGQWDSLSECLADTLVKLQSGGPVVSPDRLLSLLTKKQTQFQGYRQHDAHELFTYLIDSVRMTDHKRYRKLILSEFGLYGKQEYQDVPEETTKKLKALDHEIAEIITFAPEKVFKGRLVNRIQCQECRSVKTFEESFLDLSLPIVPDKPQPPCMRRKGGHQHYVQNQTLETVQEENKTANGNNSSSQTMSKNQLKKERRLQRKKNRKQCKINNVTDAKQKDDDSHPALIESSISENIQDHEEQQESDVEGDVEDNSEETNCGSKDIPKIPELSGRGEVINSHGVNCGNQGVWLDVNESFSSSLVETEVAEPTHAPNSLAQQEEVGSHFTVDLLGTEESNTIPIEDCSEIQKPFNTELVPFVSSSFYLNETSIDSKSIVCNEGNKNCETHVTAWLNKSDLMHLPDSEETDRDISSQPICQNSSTEENRGNAVIHNRLSPEAQTSVNSKHQNAQISFDETTRTSFLTGTQETHESGYCSEKLGCPESPQREDSPYSFDGLSPGLSGVEGVLSSRSDVSIEEAFNNTLTATTEDVSIETTEASTTSILQIQSSDSASTKAEKNVPKKGTWMRSCHPPAHVRRRAPSPPPFQNALFQGSGSTSTFESTIICNKWLEESSTEIKPDVPGDVTFGKLPSMEGKKRNKKIGKNLGNILGNIPEEEGEVTFGPLNKEQMLNGDLEESDSNSHDLFSASQGIIARPGSPYECGNETSDLKNLEIKNTLNLEQSTPIYEGEVAMNNKKVNMSLDKVSEALINVRSTGGDKGSDWGCCNRLQRQDPADSCCLHTSLAQSTQAELMTGCNKIVCDTCSSGNEDGKSVYTNSTKQTLISQAPPALVIHLKRFQVQMMTCRKLCRHVSFPLQLDLTPYSVPTVQRSDGDKKVDDYNKSDLLYTLYGVVEHSGTMNGGHYVAYVKISRDSSSWWYCISDSHVSQVSESRVLSAQAYLLFYKRITT